jgi:hypothetical protein
MRYCYVAWAIGWLLGLMTLRGRSRLFIVAGALSAGATAAYATHLLLLNATWVAPLPVYIEQCLFALFMISAVAGYWGALRAVASLARRAIAATGRHFTVSAQHRKPADRCASGELTPSRTMTPAVRSFARFILLAAGIISVAIVPGVIANYAINDAQRFAEYYHDAWSNELELGQFLSTM